MASRRVRTMTGKGSWMWELDNSRTHSNSRGLAWEISWGSHLCALPIHARYVLSSHCPLTIFPSSVSFPLPHSFRWLTFSIPLFPSPLPSHPITKSYWFFFYSVSNLILCISAVLILIGITLFSSRELVSQLNYQIFLHISVIPF